MKPRTRFFSVLALLMIGLACGGSERGAELRARAQGFAELLLELAQLDDVSGRVRLEGYVVPSAERDAQVSEYQADFAANSDKATVVSASIVSIKLNPEETKGVVTYDTRARLPDGREASVLQETRWVLVDGTWFRNLDDPTKTLRGQ